MNLEELLVLFLKEKPRNPFTRKIGYLIHFVETFGELKLDNLTTDALKVWMDQVQRESSLKDIMMRGLKCGIDALFAFLEKKEVISESPLKEIYYEKTVPSVKARNILSLEEIQRLLSAVESHSPGYLYPIIKMYSETGAKVMEVLELKWSEVNLQSGVVFFKGHEKRQSRKLAISDKLIKILNKRKRTPSDLRHSYVINFLRDDGDIKELQRILGHNNIFDTKRLYGEIAEKAEIYPL